MGMMGEAGTEMIMPATRMSDGSLGVRALGGSSAANDSSSDNAEMIKELKESNKELKEQNRNLAALVSVMQATLQENRKQANSLDKIQSKTRIQARQ
jgi:phage-related minor tail protein